ncbi:DUF7089 family protein [Natronomonas sp. EA1]|uniref:DUF7089 family protein n=1 Tax=Natronomonas sp. EA1 TaxID=3421655 RepID=UPI003EB98ACF
MFEPRELAPEVARVRDDYAPGTSVLDSGADFEILDPERAESLGLQADSLAPRSYPSEWVPDEAPRALHRLASGAFTVGAPGDGGVTWTRQTVPPTVIVKPRLRGSPESFIDFLIAEALVEAGSELPEHFLGFFEESYHELAAATPLSPADTYQLAAALYDAYVGLHTREAFSAWGDEYPALHAAWADAGERLGPRLSGLASDVAMGQTGFADAAELACAAVKHGVDIPVPFAALDTDAYRHHGASYAVTWAEKTFEKLS